MHLYWISFLVGLGLWQEKPTENTITAIYYHQVNKAEQAITKGKYSAARQHYINAFETNILHFNDLKNAIRVELDIADPDSTFLSTLLVGLAKGCDSTFFKKNVSMLNVDRTAKELNINLDSIYNRWGTKYDFHIYEKLKNLLLSDQKVRQECQKITQNFYKHPQCRKRIQKLDSLNYQKLEELFNENQDLTEINCGYEFYSAISLVLLHNGQWKRIGLHQRLEELVHKGQYPNKTYARLHDRLIEAEKNGRIEICNSFGEDIVVEINNKLFIPVLEEDDLTCLNNRRSALYLSSYQDDSEERLFYFQNRSKAFSLANYFNWGMLPTSVYQDISNSIKYSYDKVLIYERTNNK